MSCGVQLSNRLGWRQVKGLREQVHAVSEVYKDGCLTLNIIITTHRQQVLKGSDTVPDRQKQKWHSNVLSQAWNPVSAQRSVLCP